MALAGIITADEALLARTDNEISLVPKKLVATDLISNEIDVAMVVPRGIKFSVVPIKMQVRDAFDPLLVSNLWPQNLANSSDYQEALNNYYSQTPKKNLEFGNYINTTKQKIGSTSFMDDCGRGRSKSVSRHNNDWSE